MGKKREEKWKRKKKKNGNRIGENETRGIKRRARIRKKGRE